MKVSVILSAILISLALLVLKPSNGQAAKKVVDKVCDSSLYLNADLRNQKVMMLDNRSLTFQTLGKTLGSIGAANSSGDSYLKSSGFIVYGKGPRKDVLRNLGQHIPYTEDVQRKPEPLMDGKLNLTGKEDKEYPMVLMGVFIHKPTPFLVEFFEKIANLHYPKTRLHLFIHNDVDYHQPTVEDFLAKHESEYNSVKVFYPNERVEHSAAHEIAVAHCVNIKCDFYFSVASEAHLDNPQTLRLLLEGNKPVVAPMLGRPSKTWSNFWGALSSNGYYAESNNYNQIVKNEIRGVWEVPFISRCYLINGTLLSQDRKPRYIDTVLSPEMAFCSNMRQKGIIMFVSNEHDFGHLVDPEDYDTTVSNPDFYSLINNRQDWEKRYLHPDYAASLEPGANVSQPCPDVYWFPIVTTRFCNELIGIMENFGQWSDGSNSDARLEGGYENVPTRDIHMSQVGLANVWQTFLERYVKPLQEAVFIGYEDAIVADMNFVVRYRPDEQPALRPHHDHATFTINIALNEPNVDYQGGGCRFIRYDCSVTDTRKGWMLMHPGRLTHYHEGLRVTDGTRYIMISFLNP